MVNKYQWRSDRDAIVEEEIQNAIRKVGENEAAALRVNGKMGECRIPFRSREDLRDYVIGIVEREFELNTRVEIPVNPYSNCWELPGEVLNYRRDMDEMGGWARDPDVFVFDAWDLRDDAHRLSEGVALLRQHGGMD
jgi:hypothetical protein